MLVQVLIAAISAEQSKLGIYDHFRSFQTTMVGKERIKQWKDQNRPFSIIFDHFGGKRYEKV